MYHGICHRFSVLWAALLLIAAWAGAVTVERIHRPFTPWATPQPQASIRVFIGTENINHQTLWFALRDMMPVQDRLYDRRMPDSFLPELQRALAEPYDLYIFSPAGWANLSRDQQTAILTCVRAQGAGLVLLAKPDNIKATELSIIPEDTAQETSAALFTYISRSVPLAAMKVNPDFTACQYGKGRVLWFGWGDFSPYPAQTSKPSWQNPPPATPFPCAEDYALAFSVRALMWTARREAPVRVSLQVPADAVPVETIGSRKAVISLAAAKAGDTLSCRVRDANGVPVAQWSLKPDARGQAAVALPLLPAGLYLVDAFAMRNGARLEWASAPLTVTSPVQVAGITLDRDLYEPNDVISGTVTVHSALGKPQAARVLVQLIDAEDRLVDVTTHAVTLPAGDYRVPFTVCTGPAVAAKQTVRATVIIGDRPFHSATTWCTAVDRLRDADNYQLFTLMDWNREGNADYLRYFRDKGLTGVNNEKVWDMAMDNNVRVFHDFATVGNNAERLKEIVPATRRYAPIGYLYSDENPITRENAALLKSALSIGDRGGRGGASGQSVYGRWSSPDSYGFLGNIDLLLGYSPPNRYILNFWQGAERKITRSFIDADAIWGTWTGYSPWADHEGWSRVQPWEMLLNGSNLLSLFMQCDEGMVFVNQMPDGTLTQEAAWMLDEVCILQHGIARQVRGITRVRPKVALFWPNGRTAIQGYGWMDAINSLHEALDDLGYDYDFVSEEDVARGELSARGYAVLIMSESMRACDVRQVAQFVDKGGLLIADSHLAIRDSRGNPATTAEWDNLLGIRRDAQGADAQEAARKLVRDGEIPVTVQGVDDTAVPGLANLRVEGFTGEANVQPVDGQARALARMTRVAGQGEGKPWVDSYVNAPALVLHRRGQGATVYLNFRPRSEAVWTGGSINQGQTDQTVERHKELRRMNTALMAALLQLAKLENYNARAVDLNGRPLPYTQYFPFKQGGVRLFGIVQQTFLNPPDRVNTDKMTARYYERGVAEYTPRPALITFPERGYLYNVRTHVYLGEGDRVQATITPGRAELFAVLDYRTTGLALELPATAVAGTPFVYRATLLTNSGSAGRHVLRAEWLDPRGRPVAYYGQNLLGEGGAAGRQQFALNDPLGAWTLRVTDVITGITADRKITVSAPALSPLESDVPKHLRYTVTREPYHYDPLLGSLNPGNVTPPAPPAPPAPAAPSVALHAPYIEQGHWQYYFPGKGMYAVNRVWDAVFTTGAGDYRIKYVGNLGMGSSLESLNPKPAPGRMQDWALGMEGPPCKNWLGTESPAREGWPDWSKQGFLGLTLDGEDLKSYECTAARAGDAAVDLTWKTAKGTVTLRLAAATGINGLLARLEVLPAQQIGPTVITLHNRGSGVSNVGQNWQAVTLARDDALGSDLDPQREPWILYADRIMDRAQKKGWGTTALLVTPDATQITGVHVERKGEEDEPTNRTNGLRLDDRSLMRWRQLMDTTITLAPAAPGERRTACFALLAWPEMGNADAKTYLTQHADELVKRLREM